MLDRRASRRLAAIMFTDMVGYSRMAQQDERNALNCVEVHRRMVRALLPAYRGREVETAGDGFLIEFGSAQRAVHFAVALQQRQAAHNKTAEPAFQLRIGIHLAEIESMGRGIAGDGVNISARVEPHSPIGGLAVSAAVHNVVKGKVQAPFGSIGTPSMKNIAEPMELFVLAASDAQAVQLPVTLASVLAAPHGLLVASLAQVITGLFDVYFGAHFIVLATLEPGLPRQAGPELAYYGVGISLLGVALMGACLGLVRLRPWGRASSLLLNFANVPAAIAAVAAVEMTLREIGHTFAFPVWFQLIAPTLSLALIAFLLQPAVSQRFTTDPAR